MIVSGRLMTRATKAACPAPLLFFVGSLHGNKGSCVPLLHGGLGGMPVLVILLMWQGVSGAGNLTCRNLTLVFHELI